MEHSMNSYNKKKLKSNDYCQLGHNPSCGDEIEIEVKLDGDVIEDMAFTGHGCAISQASADIMLDLIIGKTVEEARHLGDIFMRMIKGTITDAEREELEEAAVLADVSHMPARVKCAVLGWHTADEIFNGMKN